MQFMLLAKNSNIESIVPLPCLEIIYFLLFDISFASMQPLVGVFHVKLQNLLYI